MVIQKELTNLFNISLKRTPKGYEMNFKASDKLKPLMAGKAEELMFEGQKVSIYPSCKLFEYDSVSNPLLTESNINAVILRIKESYETDGLKIKSTAILPLELIEKTAKRFAREVSSVYRNYLCEQELEMILRERV